MQHRTPPNKATSKVASSGVSMADVRAMVDADTGLAPRQKRDALSALDRLSELCETPLTQIPANRAELERRAKAVAPARYNITKKTLQNIASLVRKMLERHGLSKTRRRPKREVTPAWEALIRPLPHEMDRWLMRRLGESATARNLSPHDINDETFNEFVDDLLGHHGKQDPHYLHRRYINRWNHWSEHLPDWPNQKLTQLPSRLRGWTHRFDDYPASFQDEVERCIARLSSHDPFDDDAPLKPLRSKTVGQRRHQLRELAGGLVQTGFPIERITSLAVLFQHENFRASLSWIIRHRRERLEFNPDDPDAPITEATANLARHTARIARHWLKLPEEELNGLERLCAKLGSRPKGLRPKNQRTLKQFDDPINAYKLLLLSEALWDEAQSTKRRNVETARQVRDALLLEMLCFHKPRIGALVSVRLDDILSTRGGRGGVLTIRYRQEKSKTNTEMLLELTPESAELLQDYLNRWRPLLPHADGPCLFPGRVDGHLGEGVSEHLKKLILDRTGLEMTAHAFRHVGAKLHLDRHPGEYETVRLFLGHADSDTTMSHYVGLEADAAVRHASENLLNLRRRGRGKARRTNISRKAKPPLPPWSYR